MNDNFSSHAQVRLNQRGIKQQIVTYLLENGRAEYAPGGAMKIFITRREANRAISHLKKQIKIIEKAIGKTVIEKDCNVITVYHNY